MIPPPSTAETEAPEAPAAGARLAPGRAGSVAGALERPWAAGAAAAVAVMAAAGFLLSRLVPDVGRKPFFDDEVVAGLTALHPFRELLEIVLSDRGGAPLHFALAHVALSFDASVDALRWLSVLFALATIPLCYDLGRRLGGRTAGVVTAVIAATSSMLAVYGTIGRMYALFAFVSALAADLFVRALERRTVGAVFAAAVAAWLLPATHPYGLVVVAIMALIGLVLWRGRPLVPALPLLALAAALVPFVLADLRLSERFGVAPSEAESVAPPDFAARQLGEALAAFAGGAGWLALCFFGLALAGLFVVARRRLAFAAFSLLALGAVPTLMVVARAEDTLVHQLSPRHLMFGLPVWAALVGVGTARIVRDLPRPLALLCLAGVVAAAVLAPAGIADPRTDAAATENALAGPGAWTRAHIERDSVLLFYSPVYLTSLASAREATAIPRSGHPLRMVERASYPVPSVLLTLRLAGTNVEDGRLAAKLGPGSDVGVFREWLVLRTPGPFADKAAVLAAGRDGLVAVRESTSTRSLPFRRDLRGGLVTVCAALAELADPCPREVLPPPSPRG